VDHLGEVFVYVAMGMEAALIGLLFYRRTWRSLPFFCAYLVWTLASDCINLYIRHYVPSSYLNAYFVNQAVDFVLQFCVLVEIAWSVVRPFRASLPRYTVLYLGLLLAAAGGLVWIFADSAMYAHIPHEWHLLLRLRQSEAILRIIFFLILASCSHFLSIGWRDRELQVMTGLGFYSLAAVTVSILQSHQGVGSQFRQLDQLVIATYLGSMLYWVVSFAQKETARREFSPQMQGMLLAVAGAARSTRIALSHPGSDKSGKGQQ